MTFAEVAAAIVLSIAGHPTTVACDAEVNNPFPFPVSGWVHIGGSELHLRSNYCRDLDPGLPLDPGARAIALGILIHEAAHARGVRSEECAEMYGGILLYEYLERYYQVPMDSFESVMAGRVWTIRNRSLPVKYHFIHPEACDQEV